MRDFLLHVFNSLTLLRRRGKMLGMKKYIGFFTLMMCIGMAGASSYIDRDAGNFRIMNKAAGKVQTMNIPVGETVKFEKLDITVRACKQTEPFQAENFFAFVEISKSGEGKIFSGWMNRNEPGDNPLQNADYDVWLTGCANTVK